MSYPPPGNPYMAQQGMPQQFGMAMNMPVGLVPQQQAMGQPPPMQPNQMQKMPMNSGMRPNMQPPPMPGQMMQRPRFQMGQPYGFPPGGMRQPMYPNQNEIVDLDGDGSDQDGDRTTVFVGNISERAPDSLIRAMLAKCGNVASWKRVQGASGKLQAFGFCEFRSQDASLRSIRLMHELELGDKKLLVKVDAKTRILLDKYLSDKGQSADELDSETLGEDSNVRGHMGRLMIEYKSALTRPQAQGEAIVVQNMQPQTKETTDYTEFKKFRNENIQDLNNIAEEKRHIISREIDRFRDTYNAAEDKEQERLAREERYKDKESGYTIISTSKPDNEEGKDQEDKSKDRNRNREREKRDAQKERERDERDRRLEREREREKSRDRDKDRDRMDRERQDRMRERDRERDRGRDHDRMDEDEEFERRKLERKLRDKEEAYQQRLKNREIRERKRGRDYDKYRDKRDSQRGEMDKEGKRLREFLEDYDDEREDLKYYMGSALERRRKEREREIDNDNRDRKHEREELAAIKRKLQEEGHNNVDEEMEKLEHEREKHRLPQLAIITKEAEAPEPKQNTAPAPTEHRHAERTRMQPTMTRVASPEEPSLQIDVPPEKPPGPRTPASSEGGNENHTFHSPEEADPASTEPPMAKLGFGGLKLVGANDPQTSAKRKKLTVGEIFNDEDASGDPSGRKKRKLVPIEYSEEEMKAVGQSQAMAAAIASAADEKRKTIKNLIEKIPTAKDELFRYKVDWTVVDESLMERRIKPWINKKIVEYIGEEEATLTEFICSKLLAHSPAESILNDVTMVLDEEAEVFVVKMWRLLIYEVEAKKHGLVK